MRIAGGVSSARNARSFAPNSIPVLYGGDILKTEIAREIELLVGIGVAALPRTVKIHELRLNGDRGARSLAAFIDDAAVDSASHGGVRVRDYVSSLIKSAEPDAARHPLPNFVEDM